jgi:hypothetical protein
MSSKTEIDDDQEEGVAFAAERIGELLILLAAKFGLTPEQGATVAHVALVANAAEMTGPLDEPLATDVLVWREESRIITSSTSTAQ